MQRDARAKALARVWLDRARSSLILAKQPKPADVWWEDVCYNAQQAAEKALKAFLVLHQIDFPKTHSIDLILDKVKKVVSPLPDELTDAVALTIYAVDARYPPSEAEEPVTEEDYRKAVERAEKVVSWAEGMIRQKK